MKRIIVRLTCLAFATGVVTLPQAMAQRPALNPDDVFIDADTDDFDPGLPVGAQFPAIRALYQGQEINDIDQFVRDKGAVFIANRSVDW
jgi:hypothetical protein